MSVDYCFVAIHSILFNKKNLIEGLLYLGYLWESFNS